MKTVQDIWESIAKPKYPALHENQLNELRIHAAIDWLHGEDTELCTIYDQFVMMKNLLGVE